jgi:hypothetical protein
MEVDIDVEFLRKIEDAREMRVRVGVHVGTAADGFTALAERLDQQFLGSGIVGQALLREHTEFEIDRPGVVALERFDRLEAAQADAGGEARHACAGKRGPCTMARSSTLAPRA